MLKYLIFPPLAFFYLLLSALSQPLYRPNNIRSENIILHANTSTHLTPTRFNIIFNQALSRPPALSYGLNNYQMGDRFYYQNIKTSLGQVHSTFFILQVTPIQSTFIYKLSICYLASDDIANFGSFANSYPNLSTVSRNAGNRTTTIHQPFYFKQQYNAIPFITGFFLQSINNFHIYTYVDNVSSFGFNIHINTLYDCTISRLDLSFFFYQDNSTQYLVLYNSNYCYNNITFNSIITIFTNTSASLYLFGLSGFSGQTYISVINFGWQSFSGVDNSLIVIINTANLTFLCYNHIQIFSLVPPPTAPPQSIDGILATILIALCLVFAILILILGIRCFLNSKYMQRKRLQQNKKKLSVMTLNELPSLHF